MCALIVAVAMVSVGVTLAVEEEKPNFETNVVVIGEIKIDLIDEYYEQQSDYDPDPDGDKHYTENNPPVLSPKTTVNKKISVVNTGKFPCFVRLLIKKEWKVGEEDYSGLISLNYDQTNWYKGSDIDGYECYYYKNILPVGENGTAPPLCKTFTLGDFDPNKAGGTTGDIKVFAQAVQSDYTDSATIVRDSNGMITKWNGLVFN